MEDRTETQRAVKVEEHSRCVILTYFQGDTKSMVDAHFTRALSKDYKAMAPGAKAKKFHKTIKLESRYDALLLYLKAAITGHFAPDAELFSGSRKWSVWGFTDM
uniref:Uncharacterized protein n=1 Tax=Seriola lalandi dorsalis TaxID=1841481 RepID=A0A3B4X7Q5_SERLL